MNSLKVVLIGEYNVGKTCILNRIMNKKFNNYENSTIGCAYTFYTIKNYDNSSCLIEFWDTAGQEKYNSLIKIFYKKADIIIIVFDIINRSSYIKAEHRLSEIIENNIYTDNHLYIIIIGNKIDLIQNLCIIDNYRNKISKFIKKIELKYNVSLQSSKINNIYINNIFTSAKTNCNIYMIRLLINQYYKELNDIYIKENNKLLMPIEEKYKEENKNCCYYF